MGKVIGTLGAADSLEVGGRVFTDLDNLIILHFESQGGAGTGTTGFKVDRTGGGAPAAYVVPASTEFILHAVRWYHGDASATGNLPMRLLYGDTEILDASVVTPVGMISGASSGTVQDCVFPKSLVAGQDQPWETAINGRVPTGKYPTMGNVASSVMFGQMYGYEISV